jgi:hypothetical protein
MDIGRGRRREHPQPIFFVLLLRKKVREKSTGKKYGKKIEGKSHVTSGQGLFRSLPVKHAQWSDPLDPPQI